MAKFARKIDPYAEIFKAHAPVIGAQNITDVGAVRLYCYL